LEPRPTQHQDVAEFRGTPLRAAARDRLRAELPSVRCQNGSEPTQQLRLIQPPLAAAVQWATLGSIWLMLIEQSLVPQ
jgi:hypothetical protein